MYGKIPAYASIAAATLIQQHLNKPLLGRPYLKYGQCFGLWGLVFELGGILAAKHSANLGAFAPAFLGGVDDSEVVKQGFTLIADSVQQRLKRNESMTFFDYVQTDFSACSGHTGDTQSHSYWMTRMLPNQAAEFAQFSATQGSALGAVYPDILKTMFRRTYSSIAREKWERWDALGADLGPYQVPKTYSEAEEEYDKSFMTYCKERRPDLYSALST